MPKGVEHNMATNASGADKDVKIPLMPKGVEHVKQGSASGGADG